MIKSKYTWKKQKIEQSIHEELAKSLNLTPILKKVLESKGIIERAQIEEVLNENTIEHDPLLLSDMEKAVERINLAIDRNEKILVYGDYDADGVTSTTIMVHTLRELGATVGWYIPNRFSEGYGPNAMAFQNAYDEGTSLIITVDCGIQGHDEIEMIQEKNVDVIVTDHHEIGESLPSAYAIVHPMHPEFNYPFKYLCGAGVAYKLAQSLLDQPPSYFKALVAIGTVADLVSMTNENRTLVQQGLKVLNTHCPIAIRAILNEAGYNDAVTEETIGFIIGPRLNAVGRLEDAGLAAELLMAEDDEEAAFLAEQVEHFNNERKEIVQKISEEALTLAEAQVNDGAKFLLLAEQDWHEGVLGIVASKVVETYHLPTLILNIDLEKNHAKGSARSIEQVSMFEILSEQTQLITKFGGHHMAAGITMPIENVDYLQEALRERMDVVAEETSLEPEKQIDTELEEQEITLDNIRDIERLRPFGTEFYAPCFQISDISIRTAKGIGRDKRHLKLSLGETGMQGLFWQQGHLAGQLAESQPVDIVGTLQINEWNGHQSPQFMIQDLASNQLQILDYRSKQKRPPFSSEDDSVAYIINDASEKQTAHYYYYSDTIDTQYDHYVLLDLPSSIEELKQALTQVNQSQIYLVLNHAKSIYFENVPKDSDFKQCYKALFTKKTTHLESEGMLLCDYLNIKPNTLKFILKVFLELKFIKNEDGIITINEESEKQPIETSRLYQARLNRIEVEKLLLYEDFNQLKQWIKSHITSN